MLRNIQKYSKKWNKILTSTMLGCFFVIASFYVQKIGLKHQEFYISMLYFFVQFTYLININFQNLKARKFTVAIKETLTTLLPSIILISVSFFKISTYHYITYLYLDIYYLIALIYLLTICFKYFYPADKIRINFIQFFKQEKKTTIIILTIVFLLNLFASTYKIGHFAAVDEPLWTDQPTGRIYTFWNSIYGRDWKRATISDKPGVTVAIISGIGLPFFDSHPNNQNEVLKNNFALRLPIAVFSSLLIFVCYFFLRQIFSTTTSLLTILFISLSPILIGMSRIINPDALLWMFALLTMLVYFAFIKHKSLNFLVWTGVLLGLSLLTKYTANILLIFMLGSLILEIIFTKKTFSQIEFKNFVRKSLFDFAAIIAIAVITLIILYPGTWMNPYLVLQSTILSQVFKSTWPIFIAFIAYLVFDNFFIQSKSFSKIIDFFAKYKKIIIWIILSSFLVSIILTIGNVFSDMRFINFEDILISPKTSYRSSELLNLFISNFYPLIFSIHPIALIALIFIPIYLIFSKNSLLDFENKISFYFIFFIITYYVASLVTKVSMTMRYQIIIYPFAFLISAIILNKLLLKLKAEKIRLIAIFALIPVLGFSLFTTPFPMSYSSALLPKKFYTDLKDMGTGSYEAAEYLNSLPNAKEIKIWTDKKGVCSFFEGKCYSGFDIDDFQESNIDYVVISSARKARTKSMMNRFRRKFKLSYDNKLNFAKYYEQDDASKKIIINERPNNYIKIFDIR